MTLKLDRLMQAIAGSDGLDRPAELVATVGGGTPRDLAQRAQALLGHPAHPPLTDLPIGFWTSAWFLDLLPGRAATAVAARRLIGLGLLSTVPAVVSGLGDASSLSHRERRLSATHASLNTGATLAFALSWWMRRRETTGTARAVAHVGAVLATAAAAVGGHLAFRTDDTQPSDSQSSAAHDV